MMSDIVNRAEAHAVALETTLLAHGVPRDQSHNLGARLNDAVREGGAEPVLVGVVAGVPTVGMTSTELGDLLRTPSVAKVNLANLGLAMHRGIHAATTVSATMRLASEAGVRVFATGGVGGVHPDFGSLLDVSADLLAMARFPMAVVASGVKAILDVESTREALETLGVPVVGFRTDHFPAFYMRSSQSKVDARFDDLDDLAAYLDEELGRERRGVLVANPPPDDAAIDPDDWSRWFTEAKQRVETAGASGRDVTPALLGALHDISGGATLRTNIALAVDNARLAGQIAARLAPAPPSPQTGRFDNGATA